MIFSELCQICCSAGVLPAWCVYTHWHQGKTENRILLNLFKKHNISWTPCILKNKVRALKWKLLVSWSRWHLLSAWKSNSRWKTSHFRRKTTSMAPPKKFNGTYTRTHLERLTWKMSILIVGTTMERTTMERTPLENTTVERRSHSLLLIKIS